MKRSTSENTDTLRYISPEVEIIILSRERGPIMSSGEDVPDEPTPGF